MNNTGSKFIKNIFLAFIILGIFAFGVFAFLFGRGFNNYLLKDKIYQNTNSLNTSQIQKIQTQNVVIVDEQSAVIDAVAKVSDSVVSIVVSKDLPKYYNIVNPFSDLFDDGYLFPSPQNENNGETERREIGGGTGFIISNDGLIVTNKHVVEDTSATYSIVTNNGKTYDLEVLARDTLNDLAICKVKNLKPGESLKSLSFGDSNNLKLGQTVIAIGNALAEYKNTVTKGIISGVGRNVIASDMRGNPESLENIIQTDAAINPGNSGGPLLDLSGQVIGINTAINAQGESIGFAIPINSVKSAIDSVVKTGRIIRPFIGIRYVQNNEVISKNNNLKYNYGVLVLRGQNVGDLAVIPGSPAQKAGIQENDLILEIDGVKLDTNNSLVKIVSNKKVGDKVKLKVFRSDKLMDITVTLEENKQ